ncbi:protein kintoun [Anableps anableps]
MDIGDKLKELNLSSEEMGRFTKAFKDGKFREMFCDYVQEISEPENRRKYEEEIRQWEQERGNNVEFITPTPFRVIKTSGAGKQKCFINICANDKIHKPEVKSAMSEDGRRGQCWTLPHSLHPGRTEKDPKGNTFMIYDVIFHPDTLHMASKNKAFMDMVNDAAIDGVQRAFKVNLDKNNVREMKTKYKGTPQTCVIRRPIPGYNAQNLTPALPCLEVPQPQKEHEESPLLRSSRDVQQQFQSQKNQEPEKPNYTVKYRSKVDLQDFRCSRDSVQSPRPKEILITVDLPLLRSVRDTSLEVKEKSLLLESKQPAYRLHLPLAYPVDEDQGEAKFNKHTGQLTVTLPVRPPREALHQSVGPCLLVSDPGDGESPEERSEVEEEQGREEIYEKSKQEVQTDDQEKGNQGKNSGEEQRSEGEEKKYQKIKRKQHETDEGKQGTELPNWDLDENQKRLQVSKEGDEEEGGVMTVKENQSRGSEERSALDEDYSQAGDDLEVYSRETVADKTRPASPVTENQDVLISDEQISSSEEDKEAKPTSSLESTFKTTSDLQEGPGKANNVQENTQAEEEASLQQLPSNEQTPDFLPRVSFAPTETALSQSSVGGVSISRGAMESHLMSATDAAEKGRETGDDDLPARRALQTLEQKKKPPAAAWSLREIDADGKETLISDHSTSAGFVFQNKLMYELD